MDPDPTHVDVRLPSAAGDTSRTSQDTTIVASPRASTSADGDHEHNKPRTTKKQSSDGSDAAHSSPSSTTWSLSRVRVRNVKEKAKRKAKKALRIDDTPEQIKAKEDGLFDELEANPAFNPQEAFPDTKPVSVQSAVRKTATSLKHAGHRIAHPKTAVERHAASMLAMPDQPYLSVKEDRLLLEAQDKLVECEDSTLEGNEAEVREWEDVIEDMEAKRESMRVAWTTSRFVHRVRVVPNPQEHIDYPHPKDFRIYDEEGNFVRTDWSRWWGKYVLFATQDSTTRNMDAADYVPFDRDIFLEHVERTLMASAPWQAYFLNLRTIWRWEDPYRTGRWFTIFIVLWLVDYVITFCLCYVVFIVILNRYRRTSVDSLRESHDRAMDQGATAYKISELISKHGRGKWLAPLIQEVGPRAQLQLADLADFLEQLQNFYDWKFPQKTKASLFVWCSAIALGALTPTGYTMRMVQMVLILWFFTGRPVASFHPMYRHIVSPMAYVWWDVPTHAQWSFRYLRGKAQEFRQKVIERCVEMEEEEAQAQGQTSYKGHLSFPSPAASTTTTTPANGTAPDPDPETDTASLTSYTTAPIPPSPIPSLTFLAYRCRWHNIPGRLAIFAHGIRFLRLVPQRELWARPFTDLVEMRKVSAHAVAKGRVVKEKGLLFLWRGGGTDAVDGVRKRDEAFNSVVGFSALQWQVLTPVLEGQ